MLTSHITWRSVDRQELLQILMGREPQSPNYNRDSYPRADFCDAALGFSKLEGSDEEFQSFLVIEDRKVDELLAWFHSYAEELMPLSMHCRVLPASDFDLFRHASPPHQTQPALSIWSCLVLGELLYQKGPNRQIIDTPLSWINTCAFAALGRAFLSYGTRSGVMESCLKRLVALDKDHRFVHVVLPSEALEAVMRVVMRFDEEKFFCFTKSSVEDVVEYALRIISSVLDFDSSRVIFLLREADIFSSSVEKRVAAYDKILGSLDAWTSHNNMPTKSRAVIIGACAFLVGRGTSHLNLLDHSPQQIMSYIWFAVFAGLSGVGYWDAEWAQFARRIEGQLRSGGEMEKAAVCDLYWLEFAWLCKLSSSTDVFSDMPKLFSRSLVVELLPGITFQGRLLSSQYSREPVAQEGPPKILDEVVGRLMTLVSDLKKQYGAADLPPTLAQPDLPLSSPSSDGYKMSKEGYKRSKPRKR